MSFMRKIYVLILIALSVAMLCSCSILSFDKTEIRGGTPLSKEELENIKGDIFADDSGASETEDSSAEGDGDFSDTLGETVYWTPNGKTWHTDRDCHYIKKSKDIISGTEENARDEGKTGLCSSCAKNDAETETDESVIEESSTAGEETVENPCYWTPNGKTWHTDRECHYIKNSKDVICGTEEKAKDEGKTSLCSSCAKNDAESETDGSVSEESSTAEEEIVVNPCYWTPNGKTWHTDRECHYIKNSKDVICGTEEKAKDEGKTGLCSSCAKNEEASTEAPEIIENPYYWTPNGTTWHADRDCYHIKDSENVITGTMERAIEEGKTHGCSSCTGGGDETEKEDTLCYWVSGSSIWHTYRDCHHLENSTRISSGTEDEAIAAGKSHLCSACAGREEE